MNIDTARACTGRLGVRIVQAFKLTEAGGGTHFGLEDGPDHPDSIGRVIPGVECRVVDPATGQDRQPGELIVRTPAMMRATWTIPTPRPWPSTPTAGCTPGISSRWTPAGTGSPAYQEVNHDRSGTRSRPAPMPSPSTAYRSGN